MMDKTVQEINDIKKVYNFISLEAPKLPSKADKMAKVGTKNRIRAILSLPENHYLCIL